MSVGCVKCHVCPYIDTRADRKCVSLDTLLGDLIEHNFMRSNSKDRSKEERGGKEQDSFKLPKNILIKSMTIMDIQRKVIWSLMRGALENCDNVISMTDKSGEFTIDSYTKGSRQMKKTEIV